jgi:hypothetical protein
MLSKVLITVLLLGGLLLLSLCQPGSPLNCGGLGFEADTMPLNGKFINQTSLSIILLSYPLSI